MKKIALLMLWLALASAFIGARGQTAYQPTVPQSVVSSIPASKTLSEVHRETFEIVWSTVNERHFDPTFGGVDWNKVRKQYAPRLAEVKTDRELYALLQQMLGELHQSHFNIIPPEAIIEDTAKEPPTGGLGVDVQYLDNQALITRVDDGSTGARAGLRPGFIIEQIDGTPVAHIIERFTTGKASPAIIRLRSARAIMTSLNGKPGTAVHLAYLDARDQAQEATIKRARLKGELSPRFGSFPPQYTEFEAKRLAGAVGYIRFNIFSMSLMEKISPAIRAMGRAPGLILDLRGNPGGVGNMSQLIAGLLTSEPSSLGAMHLRVGSINFNVSPQPNAFTGSVVILMDGRSASTSEVFSSGLQEIGRAVVIGERSVGAALPSVLTKLPTGALFQCAIADFKTPKGVLIEGRGVQPDIEVKLTRATLLAGRDAQLDAAIAQIQKLDQ